MYWFIRYTLIFIRLNPSLRQYQQIFCSLEAYGNEMDLFIQRIEQRFLLRHDQVYVLARLDLPMSY